MQSMIRRTGFFTPDFLKGRSVWRHIRDISSRISLNPSASAQLAQANLFQLLSHAKSTVPYYANLPLANPENLASFPVLTKSQISQHYEEFLSTEFNGANLVPVTTSGSYGTPFTFPLTPEKKARQRAEVILFGRWAGYRAGDRHAYIRVTKAKSPMRLWLQNEVLMDPTNITDEWLEQQREVLMKGNIQFIIGYPSSLRLLASYCAALGDPPEVFGLQGIICTAEPLTPGIRNVIESTFGCPVLSRYSSEETGVLAHECPEKQLHHLNTASYYFEVLKLHEDSPVQPGELGRIVVTDLYSHAMPLIRYDIGDLGVLGEQPCDCSSPLPVLAELHGRAVEQVYDVHNERISPFAINSAFRDLTDVKQFQFIQVGPARYEVLIENFGSTHIIHERLLDVLGTGSDIQLLKVKHIPPLPSGKRPYILNRMGSS